MHNHRVKAAMSKKLGEGNATLGTTTTAVHSHVLGELKDGDQDRAKPHIRG